MLEGDDKSENLLDAFLAAEAAGAENALGNLKLEGAAEAQEPAEEGDEETETLEAEGAEEAAGESEEVDYVELEGEDGTIERVPLNELLEAHKITKELGSTTSQITQRITEAATQQVRERTQRLDQYIQQSAQTFQLVQQLMPKISEPDPVMLDPNSPYYNPAAYKEQAEAVRQVRAIMEQAETGLKQTLKQREEAHSEQQRLEMDRHWIALQSADPTWGKGDAGKRLNSLRTEVAAHYGFKPEEVGAIFDHRFILLAQDALKARKAEKTVLAPKAKAAPKLVRTGPTGKATRNPEGQRQAKARDVLRKTGQTSDLEGTWGKFVR